MQPEIHFDFSHPASATAPPPTARQRQRVYSALNEPLALGRDGQTPSHFVSTSGHVQLSPKSPAAAWASSLGECSDWRCGCSRMRRPEVRRSFRDLIADKVSESLGGDASGIRYVSIGSGLLLMDFEILCALEMRGLKIGTITLADTSYAYARGVVGDARIDTLDGNAYDKAGFEAYYRPLCGKKWEDMWENALTPAHVAEALKSLARFFPSTQVRVFPSVEHLRQACLALPDVYAGNDVLVHCDAAGIERATSRALACACLAADRYAFHLNNYGAHADTFSSAGEPWPSTCKFDALTREQVDYLDALLEERSAAECWRCCAAVDEEAEGAWQEAEAEVDAACGGRRIVDEEDARCRRFDAGVLEERRKCIARLLRRPKVDDDQGGSTAAADADARQQQQKQQQMAMQKREANGSALLEGAQQPASPSLSTPPPAPPAPRIATAACGAALAAPSWAPAAASVVCVPSVWLGMRRNSARAAWREPKCCRSPSRLV
jgi:hypothetical protein